MKNNFPNMALAAGAAVLAFATTASAQGVPKMPLTPRDLQDFEVHAQTLGLTTSALLALPMQQAADRIDQAAAARTPARPQPPAPLPRASDPVVQRAKELIEMRAKIDEYNRELATATAKAAAVRKERKAYADLSTRAGPSQAEMDAKLKQIEAATQAMNAVLVNAQKAGGK